jgi:hypothetical protein
VPIQQWQDRVDDRQAQPDALLTVAPQVVDLRERLEDVVPLVPGDSDAIVDDIDANAAGEPDDAD